MSRSSEGQLVSLARGLFTGGGSELQLLMQEAWPAPGQLSPRGLRALEDTLGKGAVLWLTRHGAWRDRLWRKRAAPGFSFEGATLQLLQWLLEQPLGHENANPLRLLRATSPGCELLLLAALAASLETAAERQLAAQPAVRASVLCRLAFPVPLALVTAEGTEDPFVLDDARDFAVEALQPALAKWWRAGERLKARLLLPADVLRSGLAQARVLDQLLGWAEANDKRERCTFLLEALAPLLHEKTSAADFVAPFDERLPLRERQAARRAAGAALQGIARLQAWDEQARAVRFIDDGYEAAQARVKAYEALFGPRRFSIARRVRDELEALPT